MVARNFCEVDNNIFYPRLDIAGEKEGITGMEFPLLNYCIYGVSELFGYQHWYGRLINLLVSSIGLFFFFKIIRKYFNKEMALYATLVLLFSLWFSYSRKIIPDAFAMSLTMIGVYFGSNFMDRKKEKGIKYLLTYFVFTCLGMLSKISTGFLPAIFILFLLDSKIEWSRKILFSVVSLIVLMIPMLWYFLWVPHLIETYEFWHFFMGKNLAQGALELFNNIHPALEVFYGAAINYVGFFVFLFALIYAAVKKQKLIWLIFGITFLGFLLVILKSGQNFFLHNYYVVPFVPIMAFVAGYGLYQIKNKKILLLLLVAIGVEGVLKQAYDFNIPERNMTLLNLEKDLDQFTSKDDLILINSVNPTPMYFAHRKGWATTNEEMMNEDYIQSLQPKGLKAIVVLKRAFGNDLHLNKPLVFENEDYKIYTFTGN